MVTFGIQLINENENSSNYEIMQKTKKGIGINYFSYNRRCQFFGYSIYMGFFHHHFWRYNRGIT